MAASCLIYVGTPRHFVRLALLAGCVHENMRCIHVEHELEDISRRVPYRTLPLLIEEGNWRTVMIQSL